MTTNNSLIRRYIIVGERRLSNYWWAIVIFLGSCGFLFTGISSYLGTTELAVATSNTVLSNTWNQDSGIGNFISNITDNVSPSLTSSPSPVSPLGISEGKDNSVVPFFPQGLLMSFYGSLGFLLSFYWCLLIFWNVGGGFNEFNKKDGFVRIFRWGYPGKNRKIDLSYKISDVEAIRVELKQGLDPQRTIYLCLKGTTNKTKREIPLTGIGQPLTLKEIEKQASELANFLQVSLEA